MCEEKLFIFTKADRYRSSWFIRYTNYMLGE